MKQKGVFLAYDVLPRRHGASPYLLSRVPFQPTIDEVAVPLDLLIFWIHSTKNSVCLGEEDSEGGIQLVGRERVAFLDHSKVLSP